MDPRRFTRATVLPLFRNNVSLERRGVSPLLVFLSLCRRALNVQKRKRKGKRKRKKNAPTCYYADALGVFNICAESRGRQLNFFPFFSLNNLNNKTDRSVEQIFQRQRFVIYFQFQIQKFYQQSNDDYMFEFKDKDF